MDRWEGTERSGRGYIYFYFRKDVMTARGASGLSTSVPHVALLQCCVYTREYGMLSELRCHSVERRVTDESGVRSCFPLYSAPWPTHVLRLLRTHTHTENLTGTLRLAGRSLQFQQCRFRVSLKEGFLGKTHCSFVSLTSAREKNKKTSS